MATVDIIIPLYNKETTVARAIDSILKQTFQDWRLIIVDDGSTDNSMKAAKQFTDLRISFIQQENRGPGAARNAGLDCVTAEYVAFLDADDQWYPCYLENALKAFGRNNVVLVGTMYDEWPSQRDMTAYWAKWKVHPGAYELTGDENPRQALAKLFFFHVWNSVVITEIAKKYGGFYDDEKCLLGEDTVFFAKLLFSERFMIISPVGMRNNRQDSDLSNLQDRPLDIFLQKPRIILDYCNEEKKEYARKVLVWHAWNVAHFRARAGKKMEAVYLREHYPEMRKFGFQYRRLCLEIYLSRWLPCWIKFKFLLMSPIKKILKKRKGI